SLNGAFGKDFNTDVPKVDTIINEGNNTIASIDFIITDADEGMIIEIPVINAVYIHMLGANSHSILANSARWHIGAVEV
ncbi:MAG: hypothetical protein LBV04_00565, partial [Deferribacteraceae bacterium]|nr:hypothetical protein [Deferribacteraceae bacterium]